MYKIFACLLLASAVLAAPPSQATSFTSFNNNHNSINHIQYSQAPASSYYSAPAIAKVALPQAVPSYYSAPVPVAPIAKVAVPVIAKKVLAAAPIALHQQDEDYYGPAKYEFAYTIADPHTGDYHSQEEHRDGDHITGQYSLHEADGTVRIVKYFDEGHGFNAVVERQGHPSETPAVYKKVVAAVPVAQYQSHY
ncbi:hypothetical protein ABEB36_013098 [Hypothenemus hampei]|uniref:Uncharacterized protein n=1 Tax=Hypothenemus hampei TaxID=57062 RepID=A0ABD1E6S8_HYPHA